MRNVTFGL